MNTFVRLCLIAFSVGLTLSVYAKSAVEVFESVSKSVVVVYGNDNKGEHKSLGSGVVLAVGEVVTNCHVVKDSTTLVVKYKGLEYPAQLKNVDYDRDVCSLTVSNFQAPVVTLGSSKTLKVGQRVYAVGAPQGLELTLSEGIVSSLRELEGGHYIQTSAPISSGSSGGGLFDEEGRLIGLPSFYLSDGQQLNFAVPVEWIKELPQRHAARNTGQTRLDWVNKFAELEKKQDWVGMLNHAQEWTKARPDDAVAWSELGLASFITSGFTTTGDYAKAIEALQQALHINPDYADAWNRLGLVYYASGQTAKAIDAYHQALRINSDYVSALYNLGNVYKSNNQSNELMQVYRRLKILDPKLADEFLNKDVRP